MANIKELILSIEATDSSFDDKLKALDQMEETIVAIRQNEEDAINDNIDLIVEAIGIMQKKVDSQLLEVKAIIPEKGNKGDKGDNGKDGKNGKDGRDGKDGKDGLKGKDGIDGKDGVSVIDAKIDFDGSLVISLSTGQEINVGEVVAHDLAEKIHHITTMSTTGTSFPTQTGNSGKFLKTDGTNTSWDTPVASSLTTTNFTIVESGGKLLFKYGATTIASMDSTGLITSATNIVANGTP